MQMSFGQPPDSGLALELQELWVSFIAKVKRLVSRMSKWNPEIYAKR